MTRTVSLALVLALCAVSPSVAQRGGRQRLPPPRQRAFLLERIHQQFMNQARNRLGLTPPQFQKFQRIVMDHAQRRGPLELREDQLRKALREQIRPGAASNQDSTAKLLGSLNTLRAQLAASDAEQMHELESVLSPVQQAQWEGMQERFRQQVRTAAVQHPDSGGAEPEP